MMKNRIHFLGVILAVVFVLAGTAVSAFASDKTPAERKDLSDCFGKSLAYALASYPEAETQAGRGFTTHILLGKETEDQWQEATMICNSDVQVINNVQFHGTGSGYNIYGVCGGMDLCDAVDLLFEKGYTLDSSIYPEEGGVCDTYVNERLNASVGVYTDASYKITDVVMTPLHNWS